MLRGSLLSRWFAIFGAVALGYVGGATVIFFGLPSSDFLERAFIGARSWSKRPDAAPSNAGQPSSSETLAEKSESIDKPSRTFDGFTLYACADNQGAGAEALLIDMTGEVVHRWALAAWQVRLNETNIEGGTNKVHNFKPCFYGLHLDPDGNLLVVSHGAPPVGGAGLARLDKDSNILWEYPGAVHHDIDVGQDGNIYAIENEFLIEMPAGLEHIAAPCKSDRLVVLSADGERLREPISILEAIQKSPYSMLLSSLRKARGTEGPPDAGHDSPLDEGQRRFDLLHTNFVEVLNAKRAAKFPAFREGQVLISMRHLDAIAVLDVETGSVVWAASGPWREQHDPHFLDNGHLLIFDNRGGPRGSRVIEYDPQTQAFPWSYPGENDRPFYSSERGMGQRLPNGNTLIADSEEGKLIEVTQDREIVWFYSTGRFITTARRYVGDELRFLGGRRARL
ncbi:MAG TPA: arylsulfotransferase family protein [Pirellulales bacterium]|nr:arylsulfotransferase family protein [Pirellulales bacterium]